MGSSRSHQLRITPKCDSAEPEVTGGSVSGANGLLFASEELKNSKVPKTHLVQRHASSMGIRTQGRSSDCEVRGPLRTVTLSPGVMTEHQFSISVNIYDTYIGA